MKNLNVAAIGGGTGLSTMLKGLKLYTHNISAIVTVADDGGSSGILRNDFRMLPPGDVRNCVSALSDIDPVSAELLNYRFTEGDLQGHTVGNIILAALNNMYGSFEEAVSKLNSIMGIIGTVYPVTNENITLGAVLKNGTIINGESSIGIHRSGKGSDIDHVFLTPQKPKGVEQAIEAILHADVIVLGPGSLYTSVIPNLLVDGIVDAIKNSKGIKIYVCNIMTQPGETEGYSAADHLHAIEKHSYKGIADIMIVNDSPIPKGLASKYAEQYAHMVQIDSAKITESGTALIHGNLLLVRNDTIRHNFSRLARSIIQVGKVLK